MNLIDVCPTALAEGHPRVVGLLLQMPGAKHLGGD